MDRPEMAKKYENPMTHRGGRRRVRRPDPGASGGGWPGNFTGEVTSPLLLLPGQCVCKGGGRNSLPRPKPVWPKNGSKRPSSGSIGFGEFSRVLEFKMSVLRARVLFGT